MNCFYCDCSSEDERFSKLIDFIKKAFEQTHTVSLAMQKYQSAEKLISTGDKKRNLGCVTSIFAAKCLIYKSVYLANKS